MWVLIYIKREILGNPGALPDWYEGTYGFFFALFSVAIMFLILACFLRFKQSGWSILDPMQPDAYGMFLVHYPIVLWLQYWLFDLRSAGDRQGHGRVRADGHLELGGNGGLAQDPGRDAGVVRSVGQHRIVIARSKATKQSVFPSPWNGSPRGACHRARMRATRRLAMTWKQRS